jgi:pimeloyl-ACP methyl ester carboxylesterase
VGVDAGWTDEGAWAEASRLRPAVLVEPYRLTDGTQLALHRWPVPATPVEPSVLLVHGLASNARLWDAVAACLVAAGHPVVAVDLRGHGRSAKPATGYGTDQVAGDLAEVLASLARTDPDHFDRPVVAGQSWGGNVVVELAVQHPELLRGVVGVDGGVIDLQARFPDADACFAALAPPPLAGRRLEEVEAALRRFHPGWPEGALQATLDNLEVRDDGTVAPRLPRDRHMAILAGLWAHRPLERIRVLTVPLLLLMADDGQGSAWSADKRATVAQVVAAHPGVLVRWFEPADHDVHAQHPGAVAGALGDFARQVADQRPTAEERVEAPEDARR